MLTRSQSDKDETITSKNFLRNNFFMLNIFKGSIELILPLSLHQHPLPCSQHTGVKFSETLYSGFRIFCFAKLLVSHFKTK